MKRQAGLRIYLGMSLLVSSGCSSMVAGFGGIMVHAVTLGPTVMLDDANPVLELVQVCCGYYQDTQTWPEDLDDLEEFGLHRQMPFTPSDFEILSVQGETDSSLFMQFTTETFETDSGHVAWFAGNLEIIQPPADSSYSCNVKIIVTKGRIEFPGSTYVIRGETVHINAGVMEFSGEAKFVPR